MTRRGASGSPTCWSGRTRLGDRHWRPSKTSSAYGGACAAVTGQQVGLFGGPVFVLYKALSAVKLAEEATKAGVECVPVFWLATQDHDLEEVNQVSIPGFNDQLNKISMISLESTGAPVGDVKLGPEIDASLDAAAELLGDSEGIALLRIVERVFRSDLYYRLNVFPIHMPALRDRREDIPLLVRFFVQNFTVRMGKQIDTIPVETMNALKNWHWPGNVRELANFMERSVILTQGPMLRVPLAELISHEPAQHESGTLENVEREHIVRALRDARGVVAGIAGAASRLGLKRTTLQSKMQKMGISRRDYGN